MADGQVVAGTTPESAVNQTVVQAPVNVVHQPIFGDDNDVIAKPVGDRLTSEFVQQADDMVVVGPATGRPASSFGVYYDARFRLFGASKEGAPFGQQLINFFRSGTRGDAEKVAETAGNASYFAGDNENVAAAEQSDRSIFRLFSQDLTKRINYAVRKLLDNADTETKTNSVNFLRDAAEKAQKRTPLEKFVAAIHVLVGGAIGAAHIASGVSLFPVFGAAFVGASVFQGYLYYRYFKRKKWLIEAAKLTADAVDPKNSPWLNAAEPS